MKILTLTTERTFAKALRHYWSDEAGENGSLLISPISFQAHQELP